MANLPQSISSFVAQNASNPNSLANKDRKMATAEQLVLELSDPNLRENALLDLSKKRELFQDLAPMLWHSFGTIASLLQEIVSIYPVLSPPNLTPAASNRVCNALALLQCVASHPDTRTFFLNAHIPLYLYPFLNTTSKTRPFEYLRLTSLGVIGALVKFTERLLASYDDAEKLEGKSSDFSRFIDGVRAEVGQLKDACLADFQTVKLDDADVAGLDEASLKVDDSEVISFLLSTEIIPLCLRTMEMGSELSKTVATFIVQKILLDDIGLRYICATPERFYAVGRVLASMVASLAEQPSTRLLKHIIRCYLRLSDNPRACEALKNCLPDMLRDATFNSCLRDDPTTRRWLQQLVHNVSGANRMAALQAAGLDHMLGN